MVLVPLMKTCDDEALSGAGVEAFIASAARLEAWRQALELEVSLSQKPQEFIPPGEMRPLTLFKD